MMKKIGTFALAMTMAASLSTAALAASSDLLISPNPNGGYATQITINGTKLDTATLPAAEGIPMRLVAESDYGSAGWYEEEGTGSFYMDGCFITVTFSTGAVAVNDKILEGVTAEVKNGVTFLPATLFDGLEGYTLKTEDGKVELTTPNSAPMVKLGYDIVEASQSMGRSKTTGENLTTHGFDAKYFSEAVGFFSLNISPDTVVVGKLAEGAKEDEVKAMLETYRKAQEDTFSWYMSQNLPKVQNAKTVIQDGYMLFLIAEDTDKGIAAFQDWVKAQ